MKAAFIDWSGKNLNLYLFEEVSGRYRIADSRSVAIDGELTSALLNSLPLTGNEIIYLSIPFDLLTLREQSFPFSEKDKISETITYELEGILLGSVNEYSIDHIIVEKNDSATKALAVCLEKMRLQEIIHTFSLAGLDPKVITSLDLRLTGGRSESLLEEPTSDNKAREEAAAKEIQNPLINLRRDELSYTGDIEKLKKNLRVTALLALILFLILSAAAALKLVTVKKEDEALNSRMHAVYRNIFPEDKKIVDIERQFSGNLNKLRKKMAALAGVPALNILQDIANHKHKQITLHELVADEKNIIIKGTANSFEDVESLKENLSSVFGNVKVADSGATAGKKINFTIIMQEKRA